MSDPCVFYLLTGPSHLANLAVSLVSLRRHWQGHIYVGAWPQSYEIAKQICSDPAIAAIPIYIDPPNYQRKNAQEISKIEILHKQGMPHGDNPVIYLDADTIIRKPLTPLLDAVDGNPVGFVGTQFADWKMRQGIPRRRVERLLGIDGIDQDCVKKALEPHQFSYNSGIFACRTDSPVLPVWGQWTELSKHIYISGETALHPIAQKFPIATMLHGKFNCSPMFKPVWLADDDVAIWHFHGDCNVRPTKSKKGFDLWFPELQAAMRADLGGIRNWIHSIGNDFLSECVQIYGTTVDVPHGAIFAK